MAERNDTGREGEEIAKDYLMKKAYTILQTNWHWHHFELDIIAEKEDELVIVEVKTRSEDFLISPEDAIDKKKIKRIVAAADAYARYFNHRNLPVRFDIITLLKNERGYKIDHIEDAFYAPCK